jgi:sugar phosphate permease
MSEKESMTAGKRSHGLFLGWWLVLATGFVTLWGHGFYTQGFSALFKPIATDLGLSRAVTAVASSIGRFEGGLEAPFVGWLTDRFGPRWIMLAGTFLIGVGLICMWFVHSLWAFYIVWGGVLGTGMNIGLTIPMDKAISNWFVKKRGMALSVRAIMQGFATMAVLPLIALLIGNIGWRLTCVIGGTVMLAVGLPFLWFSVKQQRPEYYGLLPDGAAASTEINPDKNKMISKGIEYATHVQEFEFTLRQAMRTRSYWLFIISWTLANMAIIPLMVHFIPFLTDMGIEPVRAALMLSISSALAIPTRILSGYLTDHIGKQHMRLIAIGTYVTIAAGITVFQLAQNTATAQAFLILYYIGFTASIPLYTAISVRYFGRKSIGSIQGITTLMMMPFGVLAPVIIGGIYDRTGSYSIAFNLCIALLVLAVTVIVFARPPRPPAQTSDIGKII